MSEFSSPLASFFYSIPLAIFLSIINLYIGIIYIAVILIINLKRKKMFAVRQRCQKRKKEYERLKELERKARIEGEALSKQINAEKNYYNKNYQQCLGYLPEVLRNKRAIEDMLHYVRT